MHQEQEGRATAKQSARRGRRKGDTGGVWVMVDHNKKKQEPEDARTASPLQEDRQRWKERGRGRRGDRPEQGARKGRRRGGPRGRGCGRGGHERGMCWAPVNSRKDKVASTEEKKAWQGTGAAYHPYDA